MVTKTKPRRPKSVKTEDCKFLYFRTIGDRNSTQFISSFEGSIGIVPISKYGGISICSYSVGREIRISYALCNKTDLFEKKIGRELSLERMNLGEFIKVTIPEELNFNSQTIRNFIIACMNSLFKKEGIRKSINCYID